MRCGAVVLRGVLTPQEVDTLERGIDYNLAHLSDRQRGDLANAVRIARETGGGLYLAATILAGIYAWPDAATIGR